MKPTLPNFLAALASKMSSFKNLSSLVVVLLFSGGAWGQTTLISPTVDGGFENGDTPALNNWVAVNSSTDNWIVGSAPVVSAGTKCAFISSGAAAWTYSQINTIQHLYYDVTIPTGQTKITLNFKWKVGGEGTTTFDWDNLKIFWGTTALVGTPVANTAVSATYQVSGTGAINGMYKLSSTSYNNETISLTGISGSTYRLVLSWKSDSSTIANPPAAVDEISLVSAVPVAANAAPISYSPTLITNTSMTINWVDNSTNETSFNVYRSTDNVNFTLSGSAITSTSSGTTGTAYSQAQTGLTPGVTYYYRIAAKLDSESAYLTGNSTTTAGATYYWVGATGGNWNTAANWNTLANNTGTTRTVVATTDVLIVDGAGTSAGGAMSISVDLASFSIGQLKVTSSTALTLASSSTTTRTITITGGLGDDFIIENGSSLILNNATNAVAFAFSGTGNTGDISGTLTFAGSASNLLTTTGGTGTLVTIASTGVINLGFAGNSLVGSTATLSFLAGSNCNSTGATTGAPPVPLATWNAASTLTISGLTTSTTTATNNVQSFGNFVFNCPALTSTMSFFTSITTAIIQGNLIITAAGATGGTGIFKALTSGTLTVNGNVNVLQGRLQSASSSTGNFIVLGNTTNSTNGILEINGGTYSQRGTTFTNNGTLTGVAASATLQFLNFSNIAQTYTGTGGVLTNVGTIALQNSGGLTISTTNTTPVRNVYLFIGTITGSNLITIGTGATLSCSVQIGSAGLTTSGGSFAAAPVFALGTGTYTVYYSGETTARTTGFEIPATRTVTSLTVDNTNGVTLSGGDLTIGSTLTLTTGQFAIGSNVLTLSGSPIVGTGAATNLITTSSSSLVFSGATTGHFIPASVTNLNGLTLNYTGASGVTVNGPLNASALVLTSGKLNTTATNILTITGTGASAVTGGSATAYVNGPLQRTLPASLSGSNTYLMPIGKTGYNSFDLINPVTNAGGTVVVKAEVFDETTGGSSGTNMGALNTNRYWTSSFTSGGVNFSNTSIRIADVAGIVSANGIGQSSTLTGSYNLVSSAAPVASAITSENITSLSFFVMGVINIAASDYYSKATGNLDDLTTWGSNTDGTGTNPTNFTNNGQTFNIRNNSTPTIGATWTVSGAGSKAVLGDGTNAISFTVPASFAMTGLLNVSANSTLTLNNDAVPTLGTVNINSTIEYAGAGSQNIAGVTYGNLISSNTGARILANSGTVGIAGTFTTGTNAYTVTGSTVGFNGTVAQNIPAFAFNNLTISNTAGATQIGDVSVAGILLVNQNLTVNAATTLTLATAAACTIAATKQLTVIGTVLNNSNAAAPFTVTGTMVFNSGSVYQHNINGGSIPSTNTTYNSGSLIKVTGITNTIAALPTSIGGDVEWNSTAQTVNSNFIGTTCNIGGKLTIISTGTGFVSNGFSSTARTLNITGNLDIQGGNYYILGTSSGTVAQLTTAANVSVSGGQLIMNTGSGSAGSGTLTIGAAGNLTLTGGTIAINNSTASTGTATLTIPGHLNMSAGTLSIAGGTGTGSGAATLNVAGNANISGGTFNMTTTTGTSAATFNLQGNFVHSAGTFTRNSNAVSTLVINGTLAQSITTTGFTVGGGTGEHSLTVNNSAGLTLNNSVQIGGTLTLTNGLVNTTAANLLTLGNTTTAGTLSGGSSTAYINGPFARTFAASRTATGTYTVATLYPVGKNATYLPLYIDPTTTAGGAVIINGQAFTTNSGTAGVGVSTLSTNRWEALISSGADNFTSTNLRMTDGTNIVATSQIFQATSAAGAYTTIIPTSTYTAGPPNTLSTTGSQILAANYSGYFAYGDAACVGANSGTATAATSNMCLSGSTTISATGYTIATGITYQWQSATDLAFTTPVDIGSASSTYANLSTGTITSTTYYRLKVICGSSSTTAYTATPVTVIVNNPSVATTTTSSRCGTGTVTLGATLGGNATDLNWYAASSGGGILGTGTSFTTPSISTNTTYYVGAASSNPITTSNLGNTAIPAATGALAERGIVFTTNQNFILASAQYYSTTLNVTNTVTVRLVDNVTGTQIGSSLVLPIVQGATAGFYTMNLNLSITPGTYRLLAGFSSSVNRQSSGADYTNIAYNNLGSFGSITSGYDVVVIATSYNYFHNIVIQSSCESARTSVLATITSPPAITATGTATLCSGNSTTLSVSSANANYTYAWTPSTGLSATTGASVTASPTNTTTYTVTATDSGSGCVTTGTVTVTVNSIPTGVTATAAATTLCQGGTINLTSSYTASSIASGMNAYVATRTTGTSYTSIIPATTITAWRNALSTDDNLSENQPIGFSFRYNGVAYTTFRVSTNGFLTFDNASTATGGGSSSPYSYTNNFAAASSGLIVAPNWDDLQTAGNLGTLADLNASINYSTVGTAGNRILTVEWKNIQDFSTTSTASYNWQIKFYEANNSIEFVYGTMTQTGAPSYSLGLSAATVSSTPTAAELLSQTTLNTGTFGFTNSNSLATVPDSNTTISFVTPYPQYSWTGPNGFTSSVANPTIASAAPAASGVYNLVVTNSSTGCQSAQAATSAVTVSPTNTAGTASNTPTLCISTALTAITHTTTGATGIGAATNLPSGVTAAWASNTVTISGTPTASGTFNYSIPLSGGCGSVNATGTITVNPLPTALVLTGSSACAGATGSITSSTSVIGVDYQLYDSANAAVGSLQAGTGSGLTWSSVAIATGYYAKATNATTSCVSSNSNNVAVATITDKTWLGTTDNSWNTASNWSCGTLPSASDVIIISSGSPVLDTNFTLGSAGTLTISGSGTLTISPTSILTIAGTANFGGKAVTIKSDGTGNGTIGQVTGTLSGATNVTVERYIPNRRAWRALTAPLKGSNTSIFSQWQNNGNSTLTGVGVELWGPGGDTTPSSSNTGLAIGPNSSMLQYVSGAWSGVTNTNTTNLFTTTGNNAFMVFPTGQYGCGLISSTATPIATTLKATGQLITGDVPYASLPSASHTLIGNPYASPLDLPSMFVDNTGFGGNIWIWDANVSGTNAVGTFNLFSAVAGTYANILSNPLISATTLIQSGQAFFVLPTLNLSTFTIKEAHKGTAFSNAIFRTTAPELLRVGLYKQVNTEWSGRDGAMTVITPVADANQVPNKMANGTENVAFTKNTGLFASYQHLPLVASDVLNVKVWNTTAGTNYKLKINTEQFTSNLTATLEDLFTNARTPLTLDGSAVDYPFAVTTDALSTGNRFRIVFQTSALGINNPKANGFSILPNPVTGDLFQVNLGILATGTYSYSICNALGQEVEKGSINNATQNTNYTVKFRETAATGIYIMKIKGTDNSVFTAKIIKK